MSRIMRMRLRESFPVRYNIGRPAEHKIALHTY